MLFVCHVTEMASGRLFDDGCVSAAVTEIIFPCTHVGSVSSQKIPLQNWSSNNQEVLSIDLFVGGDE